MRTTNGRRARRGPDLEELASATAAIADQLAATLEELRAQRLSRVRVDGLRKLVGPAFERLAFALQGIPGLVEEVLSDPLYCQRPTLILEIPPACRHGVVRGRAPDGSLAGCLSCDRARPRR